jgi:hypothetical protein
MQTFSPGFMALLILAQCVGCFLALAIVSINRGESDDER